MATHDASLARTGGIGERSVGGTLTTLLALSSDAVIAFDGAGTVLLANDEALRLLSCSPMWGTCTGELVGSDVRALFPPALGIAPASPFTLAELPFAVDGTPVRIIRTAQDGTAFPLIVRCDRVAAPGETFLLVAHPEQGETAAGREHERLVEELSRANRRLAGTLDIVLGTLDSPSVGTLFERVLEELCETMDATGTLVYLAESDGFHLRGASRSLAEAKVPRFLPQRLPLQRLVIRSESASCLRVLPPDGASLRRGKLSHRTVMDEQTRQTYEVRVQQLPPFTSFLAVPVWFGGQVIALLEVGWRGAHHVPREDADLLEAVTRYLSVQLVGAFSALKAQRQEQLATRANDLRDKIVAASFSAESLQAVLRDVSAELYCACTPILAPSSLDDHEIVQLPVSGEEVALPVELLGGEAGVRAITPVDPLGEWLAQQGEPCLGALADAGASEEGRVRFLALRTADAEPFDDLEIEFLRQVVDSMGAVLSGERGHAQEHRISQALQTGMQSELQDVAGISSQGVYSSATEAAFVGGDFYDLIRLPDQRACVIMGDVSGKGVEAASVSAAVRTALGAYSWEGLSPARMVALLNDFLLGFSRLETFATLFVGIINLRLGTIEYCSAGHPPAIVVRSDTGELVLLGVQSGVVGAFPDMSYRNGRVRVGEGDMLLLYTDGTTEARSPSGAFFGEDGLRDAVVRESAAGFEGILDRLLATLDEFTDNSLEDDVAMVALRFDELGSSLGEREGA